MQTVLARLTVLMALLAACSESEPESPRTEPSSPSASPGNGPPVSPPADTAPAGEFVARCHTTPSEPDCAEYSSVRCDDPAWRDGIARLGGEVLEGACPREGDVVGWCTLERERYVYTHPGAGSSYTRAYL